MAPAPSPRITESQVLRVRGSTTMSVISRLPTSMPSSPATFRSISGTSSVPGTPPASRSSRCRAVIDTSWASAAKITPSGPNASLLMC